MKLIQIFLGMFASLSVHAAESQSTSTTTFLFIGNSYTYYPQTEKDPGLPSYFKSIAESIDPKTKIKYSAHTVGGYSFELHFHDPDSHALMEKSYDHVVLQGQSMEALEMTPWQKRKGRLGVTHFATFLPQTLNLVLKNNKDVWLFVNWEWNEKNIMLTANHPGLVFPPGYPNAGHKWCGNNKEEYQEMINASYRKHTRGYPVTLSYVGSAWLKLEEANVVGADELYNSKDWIHPSPLGTFVTALTLVRDILHLDLRKNTFVPKNVDPAKARRIQGALMPSDSDNFSLYESKAKGHPTNLSIARVGRTGNGRL